MRPATAVLALGLALPACTAIIDDGAGGVSALPACQASGPEVCDDGLGCGSLEVTEPRPLALPDGVGGSYESTVDVTGFDAGQELATAGDILGVCVNMEHSWLRDLRIELTCPSGQRIALQEFLGRVGGEVFIGRPNDTDTETPVPGDGAEYCWSASAVNPPMLEYANQHIGVRNLPPGDYQAVERLDSLGGCTLNGQWAIKVTDLWAIDNGFIFSWGVHFDPDTVEDCDGWQVE